MKNQIKKVLLLVTAIVILTVCMAFGVCALEESGKCGDNVYCLDKTTGELVISGEGSMGYWKVCGGDDYYKNVEYIKTVIVQDGVTSLGMEYTFSQCQNLKSVTLPESISGITCGSFSRCASLERINIPNNCTFIAMEAFMECTSLTSITIPKNISSIGVQAFWGCTKLKTISISSGLKTIARLIFNGCTSLSDVYYSGTQEQWNEIEIGEYNDELLNATIHFNHTHSDLTSDGVCDDCTTTIGEAQPHTHTYTSTTKAATCTATGTTTYTCSCGDSYTKSIAKKAHTSDKGTVTKKATYTSTGTKTYKCTVCKTTLKTEEIKRLTLSKVSKLKASSIGTTSLKFTWNKVTGAEKYEVYYSTNGKKWTKVTTSKNSVTVKKLKTGTTYKVKVRAVADNNKGSYSSVLTTSTKPSKVTLTKLTSGKKKLTAQWKTISGVTGYEVVYSTSKKFTKKTTKTVTVKKAKTKKITLKKLKSGKKYYVKVRAYKTVNGKKIYGSYSSVKTVKVK